jgi:hypothetical protein
LDPHLPVMSQAVPKVMVLSYLLNRKQGKQDRRDDEDM